MSYNNKAPQDNNQGTFIEQQCEKDLGSKISQSSQSPNDEPQEETAQVSPLKSQDCKEDHLSVLSMVTEAEMEIQSQSENAYYKYGNDEMKSVSQLADLHEQTN